MTHWYLVKGDRLWVLLDEGSKPTGIEVWESPYCLGRFLDKDKPFYIRFSPEDESLYCDVGNSATLEEAKEIGESYYDKHKLSIDTKMGTLQQNELGVSDGKVSYFQRGENL